MSYITTFSLRFKPGTRKDIERVYRDFVVARRELVARGELFSTSMVLIGADAEGEDYQIISHWASKQAHDRNEHHPADLAAQRAATPFLVTPRSYSEVRHQHLERFVRQLLGVWCFDGNTAAVLRELHLRLANGNTSAHWADLKPCHRCLHVGSRCIVPTTAPTNPKDHRSALLPGQV